MTLLPHGYSLAGKLVAGVLSGSILSSVWLPLLAQGVPTSEQAFWKEAFQAAIAILVTMFGLFGGLLYRDFHRRMSSIEGIHAQAGDLPRRLDSFERFAEASEKWNKNISRKQALQGEILARVVWALQPEAKLDAELRQLLFELRREPD